MKYVLAAAVVALAIAGCSNAPNGVTTEAQVPSQTCTENAFYSPFPVGLALDIPVHFRSDRIFTKKNGEIRRAVTVEYLSGNGADAQQAVNAAMAAAGYAPKPGQKSGGAAVTRQAYTSEGKKSFWVVISQSPGKRPSNPDAKGAIAISWQLSPAPKPAAPQDAAPGPAGAPPAETGA